MIYSDIENDRDKKSLLLYLETRCVDYSGLLDDRQMNDADWANLNRWSNKKFIEQRIRRDYLKRGLNHIVELSDEAWTIAHLLRRDRAEQDGTHKCAWTGD